LEIEQTDVADQARLAAAEHLDRTAVWHGFTQMAEYEPLVIERADGVWLQDTEGNRYLDANSSLWCVVHGHQNPTINAAILDQLHRVAQVTSLGMGNVPASELAGRLIEVAPPGLNHVFYSSDGSCAVEAALKMAFQYWQHRGGQHARKTRFVALGSAYHGDTTGSVSLGGVAHFHRLFAPILFETLRGPCPDSYRRPPGIDPESLCDHYLNELEQVLRQHAGEVAAVVMEPLVQGAAGLIMHPPGFLAGVRRMTERYECLLICDEVATGFGRTGRMFACQHEDVTPDLLCLGKALSGGYLPMAATMATDNLWDAFLAPASAGKQFFHGHTFGGNPLAAAAGIASLDVFCNQRVLEQLPAKIDQLAGALAPLADHPQVGDIRQRGMMMGIELVADRETAEPLERSQLRGRSVCRRAVQQGVWVRPLGDVIVLMPPLSISAAEIELLGKIIRQAVVDEFSADPIEKIR
jgi:adenosylmethionine-8-amino-7-oxononanoate aminotransferase